MRVWLSLRRLRGVIVYTERVRSGGRIVLAGGPPEPIRQRSARDCRDMKHRHIDAPCHYLTPISPASEFDKTNEMNSQAISEWRLPSSKSHGGVAGGIWQSNRRAVVPRAPPWGADTSTYVDMIHLPRCGYSRRWPAWFATGLLAAREGMKSPPGRSATMGTAHGRRPG